MLALDIGNTLTKWRFVGCSDSITEGQFPTADVCIGVLDLVEEFSFTDVYISWVGAANQKDLLLDSLREKQISCHLLESEDERFGLHNGYADARRLGVDRWLAMLGVWVKFRRAFCLVDSGTAMTIDFVSDSGQHVGGYILPGFRTILAALNQSTSLIQTIFTEESPLEVAPGTSTAEAVQRGALLSLSGAVSKAIEQLPPSFDRSTMLYVLGGGDSKMLRRFLGEEWIQSEQLVLDGIVACSQSNRKE